MREEAGTFYYTLHITIATVDKEGLLLDDTELTGNTWVDMETTNHSITRVNVLAGLHTLSQSGGKMFSAFLYGQKHGSSYALPIQPMPHFYRFTAQAKTLQEAVVDPAHRTVCRSQ